MKLGILLALCSAIFLTSVTQAGEIIEDTTQLTLMGKVVASAGLQSQIGLSCVKEDCSKLRFVLFYHNETGASVAEYIGDAIEVKEAPTEKLQEQAFDLAMDQYFFDHQTEQSLKRVKRRNFGGLALSIATITGLAVANPTVVGCLLAASAGAPVYYFTMWGSSLSFFKNSQRITATLGEKEGWNWSVSPDQVSKKKFLILLGQIEHGQNGEELNTSHSRVVRKIQNTLKVREERLLKKIGRNPAQVGRPVAPVKEKKEHLLGRAINEVTDFLINRMSMVSLDTQIQAMNEQGITSKSFVAGFSTEGSVLFLKDFSPKEYEKDFADVGGRKSGMQFLPFELKILSNGNYRYSFTGMAFRNVYEFMSNKNIGDGLSGLSKNIDRLDFFTATRDSRISYNNIDSFEISAIDVDTFLPVVKKKFLLGALIGANIGTAGRLEIDALEEKGYQKEEGDFGGMFGVNGGQNVKSMGTLRAGIKFLHKTKDGSKRLEIRSVWDRTSSEVIFPKLIPTNGLPVDISTFKWERSYINSTLDYSFLNKRSVRPTRIGVALQVNVPLIDKLSTNPDPRYEIDLTKKDIYDFSKNANRVNLKIYVKF